MLILEGATSVTTPPPPALRFTLPIAAIVGVGRGENLLVRPVKVTECGI
jgi:hypothetical protein